MIDALGDPPNKIVGFLGPMLMVILFSVLIFGMFQLVCDFLDNLTKKE